MNELEITALSSSISAMTAWVVARFAHPVEVQGPPGPQGPVGPTGAMGDMGPPGECRCNHQNS